MKITIHDYENGSEVTIKDSLGHTLHQFNFDDKKQARSFIQGFNCAMTVAQGVIQSIPTTYTVYSSQYGLTP